MRDDQYTFQGDKLWWTAASLGSDPDVELSLGLPEGLVARRVPLDHPVPEGVELVGLREAHARMHPEDWARAGRAFQWLEWAAGHRFCGACATALEPCENHGRRCPACGRTVFPSNATAVIVLIGRGEGRDRELALARSPHFKPGVYSAIAGFTEPGESLEQAVHREVAEELGITICNLRYFGSQPWPFPNGLMVAFLADHAAGELRPDPSELEDARWFRLDALPALPAPLSIARHMLDAALAAAD